MTFTLVALESSGELGQIETGVFKKALVFCRHHGTGKQAVRAQTAFAQSG